MPAVATYRLIKRSLAPQAEKIRAKSRTNSSRVCAEFRAGTPYELVARQLGHADIQMMARVYGVYAPRSDERDRREKIAAEQDAASEARQSKKIDKMGDFVGASPRNNASQPR